MVYHCPVAKSLAGVALTATILCSSSNSGSEERAASTAKIFTPCAALPLVLVVQPTILCEERSMLSTVVPSAALALG